MYSTTTKGHGMDEDFNEYGQYEDDLMEWETEQVYRDMWQERNEQVEDEE